MNRGVLDSSPVQHLTAAGNPNWWNNVSTDLKPPPLLITHQPPPTTTTTTYLPSLFPNLFSSPSSSSASSSPSLNPSSNPNLSSWLETVDLPLDQPWSLSQLLLSGVVMGEEERIEIMNHYHYQNQHNSHHEKKTLENWEEPFLRHQAPMKQESNNNNAYVIMSLPNSPPNKSCVTLHNINEDNKNNIHNGLNLSECNSSEIGASSYTKKKPKLQVPSSQSTLKVRKEKLGGRIAVLHQLVSPFGKTDTASVLSEAIGYIRFLHSQVEALSLPYFGTPSRNNMMHQHPQGDVNGIFPEAPGQLLNEYSIKISKGASSSLENQEPKPNEEPKKDLSSRGLCLVPISCTLQVGSDNGADYWAPAFGFTFP